MVRKAKHVVTATASSNEPVEERDEAQVEQPVEPVEPPAEVENTAVVPVPQTSGEVVVRDEEDEDEEEFETHATGEQLALQVYNAIEGDFRMTTGLIAFEQGQQRVRKLKKAWADQITELLNNWDEDDAEMLRAYIAGQRLALIQMFTSMNPAALGGKMRKQIAAQVDKLINLTIARIVAPKKEEEQVEAPLSSAAAS